MLKDLEKNLPDAYKLIIVALIATAILNTAPFGYEIVILSGILAVVVAQLTDILITYLKTKKVVYADSATITALILVNIVVPGQFLIIGVGAFLAIILKHIIRFENKPVFNPVVLGGLVMTILLTTTGIAPNALDVQIGWGGSTLQNIPGTLFLLVAGFLVALKIRRLASAIAVIVASSVMLLITIGSVPYLPLFGAFFMYTEPKTSPIKTNHQIIFGVSVFLFAFVFMIAGAIVQYAFSFAFLSANILKIIMEKSKF